jgi:hypothetical protein
VKVLFALAGLDATKHAASQNGVTTLAKKSATSIQRTLRVFVPLASELVMLLLQFYLMPRLFDTTRNE